MTLVSNSAIPQFCNLQLKSLELGFIKDSSSIAAPRLFFLLSVGALVCSFGTRAVWPAIGMVMRAVVLIAFFLFVAFDPNFRLITKPDNCADFLPDLSCSCFLRWYSMRRGRY